MIAFLPQELIFSSVSIHTFHFSGGERGREGLDGSGLCSLFSSFFFFINFFFSILPLPNLLLFPYFSNSVLSNFPFLSFPLPTYHGFLSESLLSISSFPIFSPTIWPFLFLTPFLPHVILLSFLLLLPVFLPDFLFFLTSGHFQTFFHISSPYCAVSIGFSLLPVIPFFCLSGFFFISNFILSFSGNFLMSWFIPYSLTLFL